VRCFLSMISRSEFFNSHAIRHLLRAPSELNYSAFAVPASLLSEFGEVGGYEHTSSEQPGVDRVCSWSKARIRGRGQQHDPDLDSIHVPDLVQVEEHGQDRYSTDDRR
jgi:hypothetical protein